MFALEPGPAFDQAKPLIEGWKAKYGGLLYGFLLTPEIEIDRHLIQHACWDECEHLPADVIDVVIESTGGDIEAAYKLINYLRHHCKRLRMFVPMYAKSAATFFTLGADEIWMAHDAELGPLDAQILDPRHPDQRISALDHFGSVDYLRQHGYEMLDQFLMTVVQRTRMNIEDIMTQGVQYTTQMMQALYANVDPLDFGSSYRALNMSQEYGRRVMNRYAYRHKSAKDIDDILQTLTWSYPSHSFVIDFVEAKNIGLNVKLMDKSMEEVTKTISSGLYSAVGFFPDKLESEVTNGTDKGTLSEGKGDSANGTQRARSVRPNARRSRPVPSPN